MKKDYTTPINSIFHFIIFCDNREEILLVGTEKSWSDTPNDANRLDQTTVTEGNLVECGFHLASSALIEIVYFVRYFFKQKCLPRSAGSSQQKNPGTPFVAYRANGIGQKSIFDLINGLSLSQYLLPDIGKNNTNIVGGYSPGDKSQLIAVSGRELIQFVLENGVVFVFLSAREFPSLNVVIHVTHRKKYYLPVK